MMGFANRLVVAVSLAAGLGAIVSCGSRTGLWGAEGLFETADTRVLQREDAAAYGSVKCTPGAFAFAQATGQLMFVLDRSGSMAFSLDGQRPDADGKLPPGVSSRWRTLHDALATTMAPFDDALSIGAKFYPESLEEGPEQDTCQVDVGVGIPPARGNAAAILGVFDATLPNGGTPTSEAIRLAAKYMEGTRGIARTMIVATDGAPNCNGTEDATRCTCTTVESTCATAPSGAYNCLDDTRTVDVVRDVFQRMKIPVYVIGIGSTERPAFLDVLDTMAVAGGRPRPNAPRHYNVQTALEMKEAFASIHQSIATCTYVTPSSPTNPNAIQVTIGGVPMARDPSHKDGWDWVDQAFGTLAFFGAACTAASTHQGGNIRAPSVEGVVRCE